MIGFSVYKAIFHQGTFPCTSTEKHTTMQCHGSRKLSNSDSVSSACHASDEECIMWGQKTETFLEITLLLTKLLFSYACYHHDIYDDNMMCCVRIGSKDHHQQQHPTFNKYLVCIYISLVTLVVQSGTTDWAFIMIVLHWLHATIYNHNVCFQLLKKYWIYFLFVLIPTC